MNKKLSKKAQQSLAAEIASSALDRHETLHPKLARGYQLGLAMVDAALKTNHPLAASIADNARKLGA